MKGLAGFIHDHENEKVSGWINTRRRISNSENFNQNPGIP
jgi:hypothetical protein